MSGVSTRREKREIELLLEATKAVLHFGNFEEIARNIFNSCKELTGATAGYIALLSKSGEENEVLFLDSGGMKCDVNPYLPMPIRGLRGEAYMMQKAVYNNDFMNSKHVKFMPEGHVIMPNVLFTPLNVNNITVGVIGLSNKEGDFTENDARIVSAFGDLCAIALKNSWLIQKEGEMVDKLSNLNQSLELIISILKHDIINDLQVAINSIELLTEREQDTDLLAKVTDRLSNSIDLIHRMNELEKLVREEEANLEIIDLVELIQQIVKKYEKTNVEIKLEGEGFVLADQAFHSVIDNLINNAIKHSKTEKIDIRITHEDEKCIVKICDYGSGISKEIAESINSQEYRIDRSKISQLGFYIVIKTIKRYNGEFKIEPNSPKGTIMKLILDDPEMNKYH